MGNVLNVTYASSLTDLCSANSSFDSGVLRVAYSGVNNNGSCISRESFERSVKTMYNCPVVCNYDRESDTLGGHDIGLVRDENGSLYIVNETTPVGVVPESAKTWWDFVTEEDGSEHEYLFVEVLLWKRQEAYRKIKSDGIVAQSMEITVKSGEMVDGIYNIYDFEYTAFTLIGIKPCFESAALEMYSNCDFKKMYSEMMHDLKESFSAVIPSNDGDNTYKKNYTMEGGEGVLQSKIELAAKYGIDVSSLDFSLDDYTEDELKEKFEAMKQAAQPAKNEFALTSNITEELRRVLGEEQVERDWGEYSRYWYVDCDFDACEVYCWDTDDWLLYGFKYSVNGDAVSIDFESKKRKKYVIADFDEGEQPSPFVEVFSKVCEKARDYASLELKYQEASGKISTMDEELTSLREFKSNTESSAEKLAKENVFSMFTDLSGIEEFESLKSDYSKYDVDAIEEKCYAIRGKNGTVAKFSADTKVPKLAVVKTGVEDEPYGGIFPKYGIKA